MQYTIDIERKPRGAVCDSRNLSATILHCNSDYRDCLAPQQSITAAPILRGKGRKGRGGSDPDNRAASWFPPLEIQT